MIIMHRELESRISLLFENFFLLICFLLSLQHQDLRLRSAFQLMQDGDWQHGGSSWQNSQDCIKTGRRHDADCTECLHSFCRAGRLLSFKFFLEQKMIFFSIFYQVKLTGGRLLFYQARPRNRCFFLWDWPASNCRTILKTCKPHLNAQLCSFVGVFLVGKPEKIFQKEGNSDHQWWSSCIEFIQMVTS